MDRRIADVLDALGIRENAAVQPAPGGASGSAWRVDDGGHAYAIRIEGSSRILDGRIAAMEAARAGGLDAPEVLRRASTSIGEAVLLSWLPGTAMIDAMRTSDFGADHWGRAAGAMQRRVNEISAPRALVSAISDAGHPFSAGRSIPGLPDGDRLLHLDWHPLNLLVDAERGTITGVVDWDNARRGHPLLDAARTEAILTVEPAVDSLAADLRSALAGFRSGWIEGYGQEARDIPAACRHWAGTVMLADLGRRHGVDARALERIRRWTERWAREGA